MNASVFRVAIAMFLLLGAQLVRADGPAAAPSEPADPAASAVSNAWTDNDSDVTDDGNWHDRAARRHHHHHGHDLVNIGRDSTVEAGQQAEGVVAIFGSAIDDGDATDVVSIFGKTEVSGRARNSAVSVLGSTYIDGKVDGDAVAVLGNIDLGPHADVEGDVVAVLGTVHRDPAAVVRSGVQSVFGGGFEGLRTWIEHALIYARPLALHSGLGWAWGLALAFLAMYACIALLFRGGITRCVQTLESWPGHALLAAIAAMIAAPVLFVLLCITVIGIAAIPFVGAAYLCALLFGKAVMLAWLGARIVGRPATGPLSHPAVAVLLGGVVVLGLYLIPVIGFLVYPLLGTFGFGAVVYTLVLATREHQAAKHRQNGGTGGTPGPTQVGPSPGDPAQFGPTASATAAAGAAAAGAIPAGPPPGPRITASMPRAGFWIRMGALLLDVILVGVAMGILGSSGHLHLLALGVYGAVMWKLRGSTIGGIVFDLNVVRLDGRPVDWETAIVRALGCFLSLAVAGLGFIWIALDDAKQAWHDKIAGTVVVRVPKPIAV